MTEVADEKIVGKPHAPGIYFGMPEDVYHADPSLGSTDTHRLSKNPADYWFESWMNPLKPPEKESAAKTRGTAVHVAVLYGNTEFAVRYMRGPDFDENMSPAEKGQMTKAANKKAAENRMTMLPAVDFDNVRIASAMIAKNPELATALTGGMNEVSVFWVSELGIPKKGRFDCLKPRGIGDLKSIANRYEKPFAMACIDNITNYRYDVQARHYMDGRAMLAKFYADGAVHGDHDATVMKKIAETKVWGWQFVFWQSEGSPITHSWILSPQNPIFEISQSTIDKADQNYLDYMERFGPHEMWLPNEKPQELFIEDLPNWFGRY